MMVTIFLLLKALELCHSRQPLPVSSGPAGSFTDFFSESNYSIYSYSFNIRHNIPSIHPEAGSHSGIQTTLPKLVSNFQCWDYRWGILPTASCSIITVTAVLEIEPGALVESALVLSKRYAIACTWGQKISEN